jgi:hypothetical protein
MLKPDLSAEEVGAPFARWCTSGHVAAEAWSREGAGTPVASTRFYRVVSAKDPTVNGTYCEPCMMVANAMAREKKKR